MNGDLGKGGGTGEGERFITKVVIQIFQSFLQFDCSIGFCPTMYVHRSAVNIIRKRWPSAKKTSFEKMIALAPNVHF